MPLHPPGSRARLRRLALVAAATVPLVATAGHVPALAAGHGPKGPAKVLDTPTSAHRVTLVTGDVVTVRTLADGKQTADVRRPADAVGGVRLQERQGDLYVIPDEAVGLLGTDKLDPRLFDVTDLIDMGYDDTGTAQVPMIATFTRAATRSIAVPHAPEGSTVVRRLPAIRSAALTAPKRDVRSFWDAVTPTFDPSDATPTLRAGLSKLWLDGRVQTSLHESVPQIGAPEAWAAGFDGTGVTVALLDTGVDVHHPDLSTQISDTHSFVPDEGIADVDGHGTHVASTIAGTGAASDGYYKGVAPGAHVEVGKVLDDTGSGQDSWVMAGMEWAAASGAKVVNMSLGDPSAPADGSDPMAQEVNALSDQYGTLFVIAAGNAGPQTVSSPGTAASALTVGAVDKQDNLAYFSSTGPVTGTGALKPDIVAPGVDITAARSQEMQDGGSGMYRSLDGTSMATPHVTGSAAIVAQQHPGWSGERIKQQLMSSAKGLAGYTPFDIGTGRVDVAAAVHDTVSGTGSLFFGNYLWPHGPSEVPVTHDLTFTNDGDQDVTLDLALDGTDHAFTLSDSTVTVPAGGKATVQVTGDPQTAAIGTDTGWVVGTDHATGDPVTRTSVALLKEDERYDMNVSLVDRSGQPASGWVTFNQAGSDLGAWAQFVDGSTTLRMPPGDYTVATYLDVQGEGPDRSGLATLVDPEVKLHQTTDVVLDARNARLLQTTAPQRSEDTQRKVDLSIVDSSGSEFRSAYEVPPMVDDLYVSPTDPMTDGTFMLTTRWRKAAPLLTLATPSGSARFPTLMQPGSHLGTRTDTVSSVYAGDGARSDYRGISAHGKIVVVERSDAVTPQERAAAAEANGAVALIVVNDGIGALNEYVGEVSIPVATVHRDAGAALIALAREGRKLTATQTEYTPFVYDLTRDYPGHVPDQPLVYHPTKSQLAKIDAHYYAAASAGLSGGYRYDLTLTPSLGGYEPERAPARRVEWVTPGQVWVEGHAQHMDGELPWDMSSGVNTYHQGTTTVLDWFRPAVRPGFSDSFGVYNSRWKDYMTWNVQDWSSFSSNMRLGGYLPWGETPTMLHVYQGKTLIDTNKFSSDMQWEPVPPGNRPYRVVLDAGRPADIFRLSTRTHTEWRFMSDTVDSDNLEPFPVMKLDYRLATDLRGDVRAGTAQHIAVRPASSTTQTLPGTLTHVTLGVSANGGKVWKAVRLTKGSGGWWHGTFRAANRPGGYLAVRANATMNSGYSIKQEIIRAYGLR
jgi:subtilisin family serine protease